MVSEYEDDEKVFARLVPKKANLWVFAAIGGEFVTNVLQAAASAAEDVTTVFSQRFQYEDERSTFISAVGRDIEMLDGADLALVQADLDDEEWDEDEE